MARQHLAIRIHGQVQAVFFRASAQKEAEALGVFGFVRNDGDGTIYIEAEGTRGALEKFVTWCKEGPQLAKVDNVTTEEGEIKNFTDFSIEYESLSRK